MPDVAIKPATLDDAGNIKFTDYSKPGKLIPAYLVALDAKKNNVFVATKFDTEFSVCGKFTGFFYEGDVDSLIAKHSEIIDSTPAISFVEMMFPWNRIQYIRSLVYRHKTTGEKR